MAQIKGLVDKAKKSGISYGTLKKVYDRGMAAWKTGHRPGTTPQQWAFARVNSFITKGKTYHTADKDLRSEFDMEKDYKKKKLKEFLNQEACWDGYKQVGMKKKGNKMVPDCVPEEDIKEKELTPAEKKKREEIAKAIEKDNPDMPMDKKMAIATATAKKVAEEVDPDDEGWDDTVDIDEALSVQQRMKRGQIARRTAKKRSRMRKLKARRMKNAQELQQKARRAARMRLAKRMLGSKSMGDLSISQKVNLAKKLEKKKPALEKLAKRLLPAVRKQEMQRLKKWREAQKEKNRLKSSGGRSSGLESSATSEQMNNFKQWWTEAANAAQQAAIAIAKKKSGKYDKDGNKLKKEEPNYNLGDGNCNDSYLELGTDKIRKVYSKDTPGQANESLARRMANLRRGQQATNRARMRQKPSMDPNQYQNNKFVVSYKNLRRKEDERLVRAFMSADAAKKYADKANRVDSDGGKYTVYQNNKGVLQSI